ncbi:MAG TPA: hypothetical protein VH988_05615 [Thermoanaerobaculia bacterium]|jgi:hypothetical protein|nr:hypothetical protein [Thermoanaerobaculia bacterium]
MDDRHVERELLGSGGGEAPGWGQWAALEPLPLEVRFAVVQSNADYQNGVLYDRLLEASRWYRRTEPAEAADVVRLAILAPHPGLLPTLLGAARRIRVARQRLRD